MHQLLSQSDSIPTVGADNSADSSAPILPDASGSSNDIGGPSTVSEAEERDAEMEDALAGELAKGDALTDYDVEVTNEGEAINEYLALLESAGNSVEASRQ
ncbi:hypothetical protein F2P56_023220 [Juglans regia]|uniref:Uncharacterized protein n=1 Tax=Juglans regia TaxID=51240 RepID=A0A833TGD8_JUGRE|nr:hypothetical protein F2P56_023220 [Juglans regia]